MHDVAQHPDTWGDIECPECGDYHDHVCPDCGRPKDRHNKCPDCGVWYCDVDAWARCILRHHE